MAKAKEVKAPVKGVNPTTDFTMNLVNRAVIRFSPVAVMSVYLDLDNMIAEITVNNDITGDTVTGTAELS